MLDAVEARILELGEGDWEAGVDLVFDIARIYQPVPL
jgi:hypothetical protein